jgi:hypothetical protein
MKSVSRDDILNGNLQGLFLVYSHSGHTIEKIEDELKVRFEKLGYPFDLSREGYGRIFKIKGLLYRDQVGADTGSVYYMKAKDAPFLINVPDTEAGWTEYVVDSLGSYAKVEAITNFSDDNVWGPDDWRMVPFKGKGLAVAERGIINWGRKKLPISSWDGEK